MLSAPKRALKGRSSVVHRLFVECLLIVIGEATFSIEALGLTNNREPRSTVPNPSFRQPRKFNSLNFAAKGLVTVVALLAVKTSTATTPA